LSELPAAPDHRQAIDAQAAAFVARLQGPITTAERQAVFDWVAADPRHAVAFARMEAAWETSERLRADPPPIESADPAAAGEFAIAAWFTRRRAIGGLIAASSAGVAATASWRYVHNVQLYRTGVGERRVVVLNDGSRVELNTASAIEVALGRTVRNVRLVRGEALFQVAHDASRPFLVDAATARLRAVGTAFNVRIRENLVELTVTEGVVAVSHSGDASVSMQTPHIAAGAGAVIRGGAVAPTVLGGHALQQRTAWRDGVIELDGETLAQAVEEFNRYRVQPIVLGDPRLASLRVGGRFEVDEANEFLMALASSFPVETIRSADGSVLVVAKP
jgi:transmembrane sensor